MSMYLRKMGGRLSVLLLSATIDLALGGCAATVERVAFVPTTQYQLECYLRCEQDMEKCLDSPMLQIVHAKKCNRECERNCQKEENKCFTQCKR